MSEISSTMLRVAVVGCLAIVGCSKKEGPTTSQSSNEGAKPTATDQTKPPNTETDPASCPTKEACLDLALRLATDQKAKSSVAMQRACDFGDASACGIAAQYYYDEGATQDFAKARALGEKACAKSDANGCALLALMHLNGQGGDADNARALELSMRACDAAPKDEKDEDVAAACSNAGVLLAGEKPVDAVKVRRYLERACGIDVQQCTNLGVATADGLLGPKDPAKAREIYKRACDGNVADSCSALGLLLVAGKGGAKDEALAKSLFAKACKGGSNKGCVNQKKYPE